MSFLKARHRLALVCLFGALVILYASDRLEPRWLWSNAYWVLLGTGLVAVLRLGPFRTKKAKK